MSCYYHKSWLKSNQLPSHNFEQAVTKYSSTDPPPAYLSPQFTNETTCFSYRILPFDQVSHSTSYSMVSSISQVSAMESHCIDYYYLTLFSFNLTMQFSVIYLMWVRHLVGKLYHADSPMMMAFQHSQFLLFLKSFGFLPYMMQTTSDLYVRGEVTHKGRRLDSFGWLISLIQLNHNVSSLPRRINHESQWSSQIFNDGRYSFKSITFKDCQLVD